MSQENISKPSTGEPTEIEWIVLDEEDGRFLLVSKYALCCRSYHYRFDQVDWYGCSLRSWLNEQFIDTAFDDFEQAFIEPVHITDNEDSLYTFSNKTKDSDQIFLLSSGEVRKYNLNIPETLCRGTNYLKRTQTEIDSTIGLCKWWLRNLGEPDYYARYVDMDGDIDFRGEMVDKENIAVRPALWVSLE